MDRLHILLVDDDQSLAKTLSHGLRKAMGETASVAVCFNGSEALLMLETQTFDVIVSDLNMPGTSGLELLRSVRQEHQETVLVLSTAYGTDALEEGVRQLGMGYITKPFEPAVLGQMIQGMLRGRETTGSQERTARTMEKPGKPAGSPSRLLLEGRLHE